MSARGRKRITGGSRRLTPANSFAGPIMLMEAKAKPRKWEPPSPMKICAGFRL